jgi:hypothetical protein
MTRARLARIIVLGSTIGAVARWAEAPNKPGRFLHVIGCGLLTYHILSRARREELPVDDHEAATAYLSPPVAILAYHYDPTTNNALWIAVTTVWAVTIWLRREVESS